MRISETKVAQLIEKSYGHDTLVIVDEQSGSEIELSRTEVYMLLKAVDYFGVC